VRPYLEKKNKQKTFTKIGLVEWLKVKALSSNHSTIKKKEEDWKKGNSCTLLVGA
jgi:hypothetical protein